MERYDQLHYLEKNRVDHTPLHPKRGKGYIPPSFHHHFGRIWRSQHAEPHDTYAQGIMHAASLHRIDEGCNNIFSSFSNLRPNSKFITNDETQQQIIDGYADLWKKKQIKTNFR